MTIMRTVNAVVKHTNRSSISQSLSKSQCPDVQVLIPRLVMHDGEYPKLCPTFGIQGMFQQFTMQDV